MRSLGGIGELGGNIAFFALAIAIGGEGVGFHGDQIHHAAEFALGADRDLDGHRGAAEIFLDAIERALKIGALAVQLIDHNGAWKLEIVGERPDLLGLDFDAGHAIHHHQRRFGGHQGGAACH